MFSFNSSETHQAGMSCVVGMSCVQVEAKVDEKFVVLTVVKNYMLYRLEKYLEAKGSLVHWKGFLIQCAILVLNI